MKRNKKDWATKLWVRSSNRLAKWKIMLMNAFNSSELEWKT
jgi:hypothetical protein